MGTPGGCWMHPRRGVSGLVSSAGRSECASLSDRTFMFHIFEKKKFWPQYSQTMLFMIRFAALHGASPDYTSLSCQVRTEAIDGASTIGSSHAKPCYRQLT